MTVTEAHITRIDDVIRYIKMMKPMAFSDVANLELPGWFVFKRISHCTHVDLVGESLYRHQGWIIEIYDSELFVGASNGPHLDFAAVLIQACVILQGRVCAMKVREERAAPTPRKVEVKNDLSASDLLGKLFGGI